MSQWGNERTINGARFVPLFDGPAFGHDATPGVIADVLLVDDGGDPMRAALTLSVLKQMTRGLFSDSWGTLDVQKIDPSQPND